jgi:hypothetical protein
MSAEVVSDKNRPHVWQEEIVKQEREPQLCWHEIIQLAMDGIYPTEQRLEQLLDRIERMP